MELIGKILENIKKAISFAWGILVIYEVIKSLPLLFRLSSPNLAVREGAEKELIDSAQHLGQNLSHWINLLLGFFQNHQGDIYHILNIVRIAFFLIIFISFIPAYLLFYDWKKKNLLSYGIGEVVFGIIGILVFIPWNVIFDPGSAPSFLDALRLMTFVYAGVRGLEDIVKSQQELKE